MRREQAGELERFVDALADLAAEAHLRRVAEPVLDVAAFLASARGGPGLDRNAPGFSSIWQAAGLDGHPLDGGP